MLKWTLDLTVNKTLKSFEQEEFSTYYSTSLAEILSAHPNMSIEVDTKLSTLKPLHAKSLAKSYDYFKTDLLIS